MSVADKYIREGHPTIKELMAEQGTVFPRDLLGDFWLEEEESIDAFLNAMREWRGHARTDPGKDARRPRYGRRLKVTAARKAIFRTSATGSG